MNCEALTNAHSRYKVADFVESLVTYVFFFVPALYLYGAWSKYARGLGGNETSKARRVVTVVCLMVLSVSEILLLLFPHGMGHFARSPGDPSDYAYTRTIAIGAFCALLGAALSAFATKPVRFLAVTVAYVLILLWVFYGAASV